MTATSLTDSLAGRFGPIGLEELNAQAALQTRVDRKYLVPDTALNHLAGWLDPGARLLRVGGRHDLAYGSVYFDTPELLSYHQAAYGRRRRFKLRTRAYRDSRIAFLEAKTKGTRGMTSKHRIPHEPYRLDQLDSTARRYAADVLDSIGVPARRAWELTPVLQTDYRRATLLVPGARESGPSRLTIDTDLRWTLLGDDGPEAELHRPDLAVIETKSGFSASPADRLLWKNGIRPVAISKYCTGLAALRSDLPANKWARILNRTLTLQGAHHDDA